MKDKRSQGSVTSLNDAVTKIEKVINDFKPGSEKSNILKQVENGDGDIDKLNTVISAADDALNALNYIKNH